MPANSNQTISNKLYHFGAITVPASAKLLALIGSGVFIVDHAGRLFLNRESGLNNPFGMTLACLGVICVGGTNYLIRYTIMTSSLDPFAKPLKCGCETGYKVKNAGWFTPDKINHAIYNNAYKFFYVTQQVTSALYMFNSIAHGMVGAYELGSLGSSITTLPLHPECSDNQSAVYVLIPLFGFALIVGAGNPLSYHAYNLQKLREYSHEFFYHEEYKNVSRSTYLYGSLSVAVSTVTMIFSNRQFLKLLDQYILCHLGVTDVPMDATEFYMYYAAFINMLITFMMIVPAMHHGKTSSKEEVNQLLDNLSLGKRFFNAVKGLVTGDSLIMMLSVFVATYSLPETIENETAVLGTSPANIIMIITAALLAINATFCQYDLDYEGVVLWLKMKANYFDDELSENLIDEEKNSGEPVPTYIYSNPTSPTLYRRAALNSPVENNPVSSKAVIASPALLAGRGNLE